MVGGVIGAFCFAVDAFYTLNVVKVVGRTAIESIATGVTIAPRRALATSN